MIRWFYNLAFPVAFVLLLPGYLRRMVRRGNFRPHFWQRFGYFAPEVRARLAAGPPRPWLQAVSVGETLVALKLIDALRTREPGLPLVLSTTTTTGFQLARDRAPADVEVLYTPVDLLGAVRRTFRAVRPSQLVVVDGGLWPNQLWEARRSGIPTALVNARMSPRSGRRFRKFGGLAHQLFGLLDLVAVPEETDLVRWQSVGVPSANLRRTGSVKFDDARAVANAHREGSVAWREILAGIGLAADTPILLGGSTHPGEEKILGGVYRDLRRSFPHLFLIVAPRHVERAPTVRAELESLGLRVLHRTRIASANGRPDVLLLDTTGELRDWYAAATLVFIGKSFTGIGGQNPAEAVAAGKPVLFGPHMENFSDFVAGLLDTGGALQVRDPQDLKIACARLLSEPASAERMADNARRLLANHRGAAARTADLLLAQAKDFSC